MSDKTNEPDDDGDGDEPIVTEFRGAAVENKPREIYHACNIDDSHSSTFTLDDLATLTARAWTEWANIVDCPECRARFEACYTPNTKSPTEIAAWLPYLIVTVQQLAIRANSLSDQIARLRMTASLQEQLMQAGFKAAGIEMRTIETGGGTCTASQIDNLDAPDAVKDTLRDKLRELGILGPDKKKTN